MNEEQKCGKIEALGDFLARHWGDFVGISILILGTGLVVLYAVKTGDWTEVKTLGTGFAGAALIVLKLKSNPKENGNGANGAKESK